jgi:hypothetical protein
MSQPAIAAAGGILHAVFIVHDAGGSMCRSIVKLRREEAPATEDEVRAAALQFVRKVSGYRQPSRRNTDAFEAAVDEIALATRRLLDALEVPARVAVAD